MYFRAVVVLILSLAVLRDASAASGAVSRPSFGRSGGIPSGAADRRQQELTARRIEAKKKQYPELFTPKRVLGPALTTYPPAKADCGQTILRDRIVTTAVIVTDELVAKYDVLTSTEKSGGGGVAGIADEEATALEKTMLQRLALIHKRQENVRNLFSKLPLAYEEWPSVISGACPASFMSRGDFSHKASERGLGMAHYQIWRDWYYRYKEAELSMLSEAELQQEDSSRVGTAINADPRCKFAVPAGAALHRGEWRCSLVICFILFSGCAFIPRRKKKKACIRRAISVCVACLVRLPLTSPRRPPHYHPLCRKYAVVEEPLSACQ